MTRINPDDPDVALNTARRALAAVELPDATAGSDYAMSVATTAATVSIAEDLHRVANLMESAENEVTLFLRDATGGRVIPELLALLEQLNHRHPAAPAQTWRAVCSYGDCILHGSSREEAERKMAAARECDVSHPASLKIEHLTRAGWEPVF